MDTALTPEETKSNWHAIKKQIVGGDLVPANYDSHPNEPSVNAVKAVYEQTGSVILPNGYHYKGWFNNCCVIAFDQPEGNGEVMVFQLDQWAQEQGYITKLTRCCTEGVFCLCVSAN